MRGQLAIELLPQFRRDRQLLQVLEKAVPDRRNEFEAVGDRKAVDLRQLLHVTSLALRELSRLTFPAQRLWPAAKNVKLHASGPKSAAAPS